MQKITIICNLITLNMGFLFFCGCKDEVKEIPVVAIIDWQNVENSVYTLTIKGFVFSSHEPRVCDVGGSKIIDGKEYWKRQIFTLNISDEPTELIYELLFFIENTINPVLDIRLNTKTKSKLQIKNFTGGTLINMQTGDIYSEPFVFEPGDYHLEAAKNREGSVDNREILPEENAVSVELPKGKILLLGYEGKYGAIQITDFDHKSAEAKWWYQIEPSTDFTSKKIQSGEAHLYENYVRQKEIAPNKWEVKDVGSKLYIEFDDIKILWSASNWLYIPKSYEYKLTDLTDIKELKIKLREADGKDSRDDVP